MVSGFKFKPKSDTVKGRWRGFSGREARTPDLGVTRLTLAAGLRASPQEHAGPSKPSPPPPDLFLPFPVLCPQGCPAPTPLPHGCVEKEVQAIFERGQRVWGLYPFCRPPCQALGLVVSVVSAWAVARVIYNVQELNGFLKKE